MARKKTAVQAKVEPTDAGKSDMPVQAGNLMMDARINRTSSPFWMIASALDVRSIATPAIFIAQPDEPLETVWERFMEMVAETWFCLVREDNRVVGYLTYDDESFELAYEPGARLTGNAGDHATPISADLLVADSTKLVDLPALFEKHFFFFVLTGNEITHVVAFPDLDKLPMKLCLFALLLDVEARLLSLLKSDYSRLEENLQRLPSARLKKAQELCKMKYRVELPETVLQCTTFIDKKTILRQMPDVMERLPFSSKHRFDSFFKQVEDVRNQIAHSDSIMPVLGSPQKFNEFVMTLQRVIAALDQMLGRWPVAG